MVVTSPSALRARPLFPVCYCRSTTPPPRAEMTRPDQDFALVPNDACAGAHPIASPRPVWSGLVVPGLALLFPTQGVQWKKVIADRLIFSSSLSPDRGGSAAVHDATRN